MMTWNNYGLYNGQPDYGWDIDYIIPLKTAKTEEDIIRLNNYTNLQTIYVLIITYYLKLNTNIKTIFHNYPHNQSVNPKLISKISQISITLRMFTSL